MGLLEHYLLFVLQCGTVAATLALALLFGLARRARRGGRDGHLQLRRLDLRLRELGRAVRDATLEGKALKQAHKADDNDDRRGREQAAAAARVFVIDFDGDIAARQVAALAEEVSAILGAARDGDEVLVRLHSPGGVVHGYGLGASQLARIRARGLRLTVAVDKVAASGGYMMAAVADDIVAAPFAVLGSIGVVGTVPNIKALLDKHGVAVEQHTAGRFKRTLSMVGDNDDAARDKFKADLAEVHDQFRSHLRRWRPALDVEAVATGETWLGERARELGLVDSVGTSDDWLLARRDRPLVAVRWQAEHSVGERLSRFASATVDAVLTRLGS